MKPRSLLRTAPRLCRAIADWIDRHPSDADPWPVQTRIEAHRCALEWWIAIDMVAGGCRFSTSFPLDLERRPSAPVEEIVASELDEVRAFVLQLAAEKPRRIWVAKTETDQF